MRTTELESQIQDIESKLAKLMGNSVDEVWVLTPISHQPAPPQSVLVQWLQTLGLGHAKALAVPSRHRGLAALAITPGHDSAPQPEGWTCVYLGDTFPGAGHAPQHAWHNPVLARLYREFISQRGG